MPRNVKGSDDEWEMKGTKKARTLLNSSVLDSPLRRSTRNRQPANQDGSSPESTSDVSTTGTTRTARRRTIAMDTIISQPTKQTRNRNNSGTSDISEVVETESLAESTTKRITRRSIAAMPSSGTPTRGRRAALRAESESKSTPPVARVTRRTRASSMEPEVSEPIITDTETSAKFRKRASVLPSEPVVVEESEDVKTVASLLSSEQTVHEADEDNDETTNNTSKLAKEKSKPRVSEADEKMDNEESFVKSGIDTIARSIQENSELPTDNSNSPMNRDGLAINADSSRDNEIGDTSPENRSISSPNKTSSCSIDNILNKSTEMHEKSPSNKENEICNKSIVLDERHDVANADVRILHRKSLNSEFMITSDNHSTVNETSDNYHAKGVVKNQEIVTKDSPKDSLGTVIRKEYMIDTDCVVVLETMKEDIRKKVQGVRTSNASETPENDSKPKVCSESFETEDLENAKVKNNENVKDVNALKTTNSVSISNDIQEIKEDNDEIQIIADINQPTKTFNLDDKIVGSTTTLSDTSSKSVAEKIPMETVHDDTNTTREIITLEETTEASVDEKSPTKRSSLSAESTIRRLSLDQAKSQELEKDEDVCDVVCEIVKDRKSSIVTESPMKGTNVVEASKMIEEDDTDKRLSKGSLQKANKDRKHSEEDIVDEMLSKKEEELRVTDSENESDSIVYPSFKDIPADEWVGEGDNEGSKTIKDEDKSSVHSLSTEANDSEYELVLADKEPCQVTEKENVEKTKENIACDSDDTVIEGAGTPTKNEEKIGTRIQNVESSIDVSSDVEEDEGLNTSKHSASKRSSLNNSTKLQNKNNPGKTEDPEVDSPINSNISKRKSLASTDDTSTMHGESTDNFSNVEANVSSKFNKSLKNRNSIERQQDQDSSDDDVDSIGTKTPKTSHSATKKSQVESASKSKNASPATSKLISSGTPVNKKAKDTPDKRRSMNKSSSCEESKVVEENDPELGLAQTHVDQPSNIENVVGDSPAKDEGKESRSKKTTVNDLSDTSENGGSFEKLTAIEDQSNNSTCLTNSGSPRKSISKRKSLVIAHENSDSETDSQPNLNHDGKSESARKSLSNKNISRIEQLNSGSEVEDDVPSHINESIKSDGARKSLNDNKNNSRISQSNSLLAIDLDDSLPTPQSQKQQLNKSAKSESSRKSISNKSISKIVKSDSEVDEDDSQENLNKSGKFSSPRKSLNSQKNNSKIATAKSDSDMDDDDSQENLVSPKMSEEKLNKSAKRGSARKSFNNSGSKIADTSSDFDGEIDVRPELNKSTKLSSTKTPSVDPNYSTMGQVNSDSEAEKNVESNSSENETDTSTKLPRFLFDVNSSGSSNSGDNNDEDDESARSIDSDIAKEMNLDGKSIIKYSDDDVPGDDCMVTESESSDADDDASDLNDFVVGDDEEEEEEEEDDEGEEEGEGEEEEESYDEAELDLNSEDDEPPIAVDIKKGKIRKRIIPRPARDSDSADTDVEISQPSPVKSNESKVDRTPNREKYLNDSKNIVELPVKTVDLNESSKSSLKKKKKMHEDLLLQSSTPKPLASECLLSEKSHSSQKKKSATIEIASTKKSPKLAVAEVVKTPSKHGSSFKESKTPKNFDTDQQQLQTSIPRDLNVSGKGTKSPKTKSINVSSLHHTMTTPNSDSPEIRFLMKEKLNDTMPALKLQQKKKSSRRSTLDNVCEDADAKDKDSTLVDDNVESVADAHVSIGDEAEASATEVINTEKKKKKKKKKKKNQSNVSVEAKIEVVEELKDNEEVDTMAVDSKECSVTDEITKKSKKRKRNKKSAEEDVEMQIVTETQEVPKKKKKDKNKETLEEENVEDAQPERSTEKNKRKTTLDEENVEDAEMKETKKKKRKNKKKQKTAQIEESEVSTSRKNISRESENDGDSDDAPIAVGFDQARTSALEEMKKITESIKAGRTTKKQRQVASRANVQQGLKDTRDNNEKSKTSIKRLPDDVLDSLSDVAARPNKRRKVAEKKVFVPSRTMFHSDRQTTTNINVSEDFIPLSTSGGTTKFGVVNLKKATQTSKKSTVVETFRERMLARNPRQPVSAYIMYQHKQKSSGKDRLY